MRWHYTWANSNVRTGCDTVDIKQIESKFWELKGKLVSGVIDRSEFEEALKNLKVRDENGDWWRLSEEKGKWTYFDGDSWVEGDGPRLKSAVEDESTPLKQADEKVDEPEGADDSSSNAPYADKNPIESTAHIEVHYNFVEPVDDDYDFGIEADHLHGTMKELETVRLPEGFEEALASGKPRQYVKLSEVTKKENIKKNWKRYFSDKKEVAIKDDDIEIESSTQTSTSKPSTQEIVPTVRGKAPEVPVSKLTLGLGGSAATKLAASTLKSAGKKAVRSAGQKAVDQINDKTGDKVEKKPGKMPLQKNKKVFNNSKEPKKTKEVKNLKKHTKVKHSSKPADLSAQMPEAQMLKNVKNESQATGDPVKCQKCGSFIKSGMKFCTSCGAKVDAVKVPVNLCSACGHENKPDSKFCIKCGNKMNG